MRSAVNPHFVSYMKDNSEKPHIYSRTNWLGIVGKCWLGVVG